MRLLLRCLAAVALGFGVHAEDVPAPVNCAISVTAIRCAAHAVPAEEALQKCVKPIQVWQALRRAKGSRLLYQSRRDVACADLSKVDFVALERRPVVFLGAGPATNAVRDYGLSLHLHLRRVFAGGEAVFIIDWSGSWSDSPQLMARWEALAVRGFNAASKIPGLVYQKTEEDEDGFVDTGHGTDISGFFKKKPKNPPSAETGTSGDDTPAEPDYLTDTGFESAPLEGQCVARSGEMIIARQALSAKPGADNLLLVIHLR